MADKMYVCHVNRLTGVTRMAPSAVHCCRGRRVVRRRIHARNKFHLCARDSLRQLGFVHRTERLNFDLRSVHRLLSVHVSPRRRAYRRSGNVIRRELRRIRTQVTRLRDVRHSLRHLGSTYYKATRDDICYSVLRTLRRKTDNIGDNY